MLYVICKNQIIEYSTYLMTASLQLTRRGSCKLSKGSVTLSDTTTGMQPASRAF